MRTSWLVVVWALCAAVLGCSTGVRPDADVARAVERAELKWTDASARDAAHRIAIASADDDLPVAPSADDDPEARPQPQGAVNDAADEPPALLAGSSYAAFSVTDSNPFLAEQDRGLNGSTTQQKRGLPHLRLELGKFNLNGVPVDLKCSIKHKFLMFGAKFTL